MAKYKISGLIIAATAILLVGTSAPIPEIEPKYIEFDSQDDYVDFRNEIFSKLKNSGKLDNWEELQIYRKILDHEIKEMGSITIGNGVNAATLKNRIQTKIKLNGIKKTEGQI